MNDAIEARDEAELPLQLRILDLASGIAGKSVRYEERLRRGPDTLRFTCAVIADLEDGRRVVAIDSAVSTYALESIYPTAREPMIEGEWRRARANLLAALSDPRSEARQEMSGARK